MNGVPVTKKTVPMLFRRRIAETTREKIRKLVWPTMSFRRVFEYYKYRTVRIQASEHSIAAGVAFGCLVSWTPLFGTHLLQCLLFCWITRTNVIAAFIGTAFGNLVTTPFLMLIAYHVGQFVLDIFGFDPLIQHSPQELSEVTETALQVPHIFLPTLIGGYVVGILTFPLYYYPTYYMVRRARAARAARIERKAHKEALKMTGQVE